MWYTCWTGSAKGSNILSVFFSWNICMSQSNTTQSESDPIQLQTVHGIFFPIFLRISFKILLSSTVNAQPFSLDFSFMFFFHIPSCIEFHRQMWLKRFNGIESHLKRSRWFRWKLFSIEDLFAHFTITMTNPLNSGWLATILLIYQQFIEFKYFATYLNTVTYLNYAWLWDKFHISTFFKDFKSNFSLLDFVWRDSKWDYGEQKVTISPRKILILKGILLKLKCRYTDFQHGLRKVFLFEEKVFLEIFARSNVNFLYILNFVQSIILPYMSTCALFT